MDRKQCNPALFDDIRSNAVGVVEMLKWVDGYALNEPNARGEMEIKEQLKGKGKGKGKGSGNGNGSGSGSRSRSGSGTNQVEGEVREPCPPSFSSSNMIQSLLHLVEYNSNQHCSASHLLKGCQEVIHRIDRVVVPPPKAYSYYSKSYNSDNYNSDGDISDYSSSDMIDPPHIDPNGIEELNEFFRRNEDPFRGRVLPSSSGASLIFD